MRDRLRALLRRAGRFLLDVGQPPMPTTITNRAQLLREPSEGDDCDAFVPGTPDGDGFCYSDGHYLCRECANFSRESERWPVDAASLARTEEDLYAAGLTTAQVDGVVERVGRRGW